MRNFRHIQYLLLTAKYGSYAAAAKEIYVAEPSIWKAVKEVEKEYGITVFEKTSRGLIITEEGREFISYAQSLADQVDFIDEMYEEKRKNQTKCFFVSSQHYHFVVTAFKRLLPELDGNYNVGIREGDTTDIFEDVAQGFSNLGFIYISESGEKYTNQILKSKGLEFHRIKVCPPCAYLSLKSPLAKKKTISLSDLQDKTFVYFQQKGNSMRAFSEQVINEQDYPRRVGISDKDAMEDIIADNIDTFGIGSGALTSHSRLRLITIPIEDQEAMEIGWIHPENKDLSSISVRFLELIDQALIDDFAGLPQ